MLPDCLNLFYTFAKIGFLSFGGGYAMLSMIMTESARFAITPAQLADLNALDMVVPGAIAINSATYVGYLYRGLPGAVAATLGVSLPSFVLAVIVMRFMARFSENPYLADILSGVKPAAVGLIAAAAMTIASSVLLVDGKSLGTLLSDPLGTVSIISVLIFVLTAVAGIRFKINPILLTALSAVVGAIFLR